MNQPDMTIIIYAANWAYLKTYHCDENRAVLCVKGGMSFEVIQ